MNKSKFRGAWPVLLTPFGDDNKIDFAAYREILAWYIQQGVDGLFANALSSEMFHLSDDERLGLIREAVNVANGRVPVVATGTFGESLEAHVNFCHRVADTGVDAVILLMPTFYETDGELERYYLTITERLQDVELGLYECPVPRRRLLGPSLVGKLARTGRFGPFKETSCDLETIECKVQAAKGTPMAILQANTPYLLKAIQLGASGIMGLSVNVVPEVVAEAVRRTLHGDFGPGTQRLHALACEVDLILRAAHPPISKYMLSLRGLPISPRSRAVSDDLSSEWRYGIEKAMRRILEVASEPLHEMQHPSG
ncbi:MAG TPA: dihydrodipicolinate synthase family protein [Anaerolineae bacterium]|nr:dihydrodipicolinate synthase family protein [Anaerolineae bacterium]